ncbi:MAG TPA: hypothetical protein VGF70_11840 [Solirubrobacteraceae bacterium]|jgi:hypothetical protein
MRRTAPLAAVAVVSAVAVSACGASQEQRASRTTGAALVSDSRSIHQNRVLSLAGLGTFTGRCPRGARFWTLRFVSDNAEATDTVSYRVGRRPRRTVDINPGHALSFQLAPNAARTHEPKDRFVPPVGQPRGRSSATSVPTTLPLRAVIYQATESQTLQADVRITLATIGGESGQCVLVGSSVRAYTYPTSLH